MQNTKEQNRSLLSVLLVTFQTPFMGSSLSLAIPAIGKDLGAGPVELSWVMTGYILTTAALLLPFGRWSDFAGRKRMLAWGTAALTVTSIAAALAPTAGWLIALRCLQGVASALTFATAMAILVDEFPPQARGRVFGWTAAATYTGLSAGPVLGGLLTDALSWHSLFYLPALLSAAAFVVTLPWWQKTEQEAPSDSYDWPGAVLYVLALVATMYGLANVKEGAWAWGFAGTGAVLGLAFFWRQLLAASPLIRLRELRGNLAFLLSSLAALIHYSATFAASFMLSLYLQTVRDFGARDAGLVLLAQPALMALFSPLAGALSDRIQPRLLASAGMAMSMVGLLAFSFLGPDTPTWMLMSALALSGTGFALFSSPNTNAVMSSVARPLSGIASSVLSTMRMVGQSTSMAMTALILSWFIQSDSMGPHLAGPVLEACRVAFLSFTGLCAVGVVISMFRGRVPQP